MEGMQGKACEFMEEEKDDVPFTNVTFLIFDNLNEGVAIIDNNKKIVKMNLWMKKIFGDDILGRKCYEVFRNRSVACPACPLENALEGEGTECVVVEEDIEGRKLEFHLFAFPALKKNIPYAVVHVRESNTLEMERLEWMASHVREWMWEAD
jgi:hypothetical protein